MPVLRFAGWAIICWVASKSVQPRSPPGCGLPRKQQAIFNQANQLQETFFAPGCGLSKAYYCPPPTC
ncbi:hypothetical protein KCP70_01335 [Salmonella enterica subsp. enterica]|nr:hypothetical protein KCP70_01335 [Salmonella enterica subsp. enterica]